VIKNLSSIIFICTHTISVLGRGQINLTTQTLYRTFKQNFRNLFTRSCYH